MIIGFADAVREFGDNWIIHEHINVLNPSTYVAMSERVGASSVQNGGRCRDGVVMFMATRHGRLWQIEAGTT